VAIGTRQQRLAVAGRTVQLLNPCSGTVQMRVSLFHNQKAGDNVSLSWIEELIAAHGHQIVRVFDREAAIAELIDERTELVVAAGGDGTVSAAARLLADRPIPLAILPLGTANNIAKTMQGNASSEQLVAGWNTATRRRVDVGVVRGVWGERRFLEAVGVGLVPASIASIDNEPLSGNDVASNLASAIERYTQVLSTFEPRHWTLRLDGEELSGAFILAEVLNTRSVGPNLVLSENADPSDGCFSVVTAGEEQRDAVARYLTDRLEGRDSSLSLPERRARHVELQGQGDTHVDDELIRSAIPGALSIHIEPAAVEVLINDRGSGFSRTIS
jgi:diacylglycerol kinase (ATP)